MQVRLSYASQIIQSPHPHHLLSLAPIPQSTLKLFKLGNPNSAYPVLRCLSHENDNEALVHAFPHLSLPPD